MKNSNTFSLRLTSLVSICLGLILLIQSSSCKKNNDSPIVNEESLCVNVVDLGADNTGQTDCSSILQNAINRGENLCFTPGIYRIDEGLIFNSDSTQHIFDEASLYSPNSIRLITVQGNNIKIHGLRIDMNHTSVDRFAIQILKPSTNVKLTNCQVMNLKGRAGQKYQVGLYIELDGVLGFEIDSCKFSNIELVNNGDTSLDFVNGIYLSTSEYSNPSIGTISNCEITNVFNTSNGSDKLIDADGIRFYNSSNNLPVIATEPRIKIINCSFNNCQKRGIKISGCSDINVANIQIFNNRTDHYGHEGIRVHGSERIYINNVSITGNYIRGIWIGDNNLNINIDNLNFDRQPTVNHSISLSWALRIEPNTNTSFLEQIHCSQIQVKNSKGIRIANANNITVDQMTVFDIASNSFDDDGEGDSNITYFDNLVEIEKSSDITLANIDIPNPLQNVPTALRIENSQSVTIENSWFRGWGNSVFEVEEKLNENCSNINLTGGGVEQMGFLTSWLPFFRTVSFISENNGTANNGINNVHVEGWNIICPQIPVILPEYDYVCLFETPNSEFNNFFIEYKGQTANSLSSLLFLTDVDQSTFNNIELKSNSEVRCIYLIEAANTSIDNVKVCVPNSWIGVSTSCVNIDFGVFFVLNDFNQTVANSLDQPSYVVLTTCQ